jgi:hypothetical protein
MRKRVRIAAILAATFALPFAATPPSHAHDAAWEHDHGDKTGPSSPRKWTCTTGTDQMYACFAPHGEWFYAKDNAADYWSPVIQWSMEHADGAPNDRRGYIWNLAGHPYIRYQNKTFPENRQLWFRVCLGSHSSHEVEEQTCSTSVGIRT